jgi:hypothetical protein
VPTPAIRQILFGGRRAGPAYSAAATQYFARLGTQPAAARKTLMAALIDGLVSDSIWTSLDILYLDAGPATAADALVNVKSSSFTATYGGGMSLTDWALDLGFQPGASGRYLNTNLADNNGATNWLQNTASLGVWVNVDGGGANSAMGTLVGDGVLLIPRNGAGSLFTRVHFSGNFGGAAVADRKGFTAASRTTSTNTNLYRNSGTPTNSDAGLSTAPVAQNLIFFGTDGIYSVDRQAAGFIGALSSVQIGNLYTRLNTFLTAIGAN